MEPILKKKSLNFIINALNMGLSEVDDLSKIEIISESKPDMFIRHIEIYTAHDTVAIIKQKNLNIISFEPETGIYIVYNTVVDAESDKKTLLNMPLYEMKFMGEIFGEVIFFDEEIWDLILLY